MSDSLNTGAVAGVLTAAIYALDEGLTEWSSRCLRQPDHVVPVADATGDPRTELFDRLRTVDGPGLVMSGGRAKGYAHIGVLKALEERGIAVDMVGGSSMGALVAAAHAMGYDADGLRELFNDLVSTYRPFTEYAVPFVSILSGSFG